MVNGVVSVWPTWVVSFLTSIVRSKGEIWLRQEQHFLQTIRRFLQRKPNIVKTFDCLCFIYSLVGHRSIIFIIVIHKLFQDFVFVS